MTATAFLSVALGGALGAVARYGVGIWLARLWGGAMPVGAVAVNIAGCFAMGVAAVVLARADAPLLPPLMMSGFLGGFTTFSTFSLEAHTLWMQGQGGMAVAYTLLTVVGSLAGFAAGGALARGALGP